MAEIELRAGLKVDLASGAELSAVADRMEAAIAALDAELTQRPTQLVVSDAAGAVGALAPVQLFRCPEGFSCRLMRWGISSPAATPAAPITTGWMAFYTDAVQPQALQLFLPVSGVVAPVVLTDNRVNAVWLRSGEQLVAVGAGLPINTQFGFNWTMTLYADGKG